jgi:hypothetical protein
MLSALVLAGVATLRHEIKRSAAQLYAGSGSANRVIKRRGAGTLKVIEHCNVKGTYVVSVWQLCLILHSSSRLFYVIVVESYTAGVAT